MRSHSAAFVFLLASGLVACAYGAPQAPTTTPAPAPVPVPTFAKAYTATGYILLPYANLKEPFVANFDANQSKSRIDYYNGTMKTFQIATQYTNTPAQGAAFKVVWSPNAETHVPEQTCYQANATDKAPVAIQSVFPDLTGFKYIGQENCSTNSSAPDLIKEKTLCDKWSMEAPKFNRSNTYTFWGVKDSKTASGYRAVRYVMMGYDSLFGSHYDEYEMIYTSVKEGAQDANVFDVVNVSPAGRCVAYPAGSGLSSGHLFNPIKEFVHHDESHLDEHFGHFKTNYGKSYSDAGQEALRQNNFRHNQRFVNSQNRKNAAYQLRVNHLADLHRDEMKFLRGRKFVSGPNGGAPFPAAQFAGRQLPDQKDWRQAGVVSAVKDQAICGSCWSFGTTGHLEAMYTLKYQKNVTFSEQQLVDCSWGYGNGACDGGQDYQAYRYIIDYGLASDEAYGSYLGIDGKCKDQSVKKTIATLLGYANVTGVDNLKQAVAFVGPISVGIDAAHETLSFYSSGIYNDPDCKNKPEDLDHAVLAVGYGKGADGTWYWIIKNSWSTHWGDQGYVKMAMKNNLCGVATAATYAVLP